MKNILLPGVLICLSLGVVSLGIGGEVNEQACQQALQNNCSKCHALKRACTELDKPDANWKEVVSTMGKRGKLSQEVQDTVFTCLTTMPEPKKLVCDK